MPEDSNRFLKDEGRRLSDENHDLKQELQALRESVRALSALYNISQRITPETDVVNLLSKILDAAMAVLKASDGSLMLMDEELGELVFVVVRGEATGRLEGYRLPKGQGIAGSVAASHKPEIIRDPRRDPRFYASVDETLNFRTRSMVCVPVYLDDGRTLGVINALNKVSDREFTEDDLDLMLVVAQLAATAIRRAERATEQRERQKRRSDLLKNTPT
jgi:GAF domain-containing protein